MERCPSASARCSGGVSGGRLLRSPSTFAQVQRSRAPDDEPIATFSPCAFWHSIYLWRLSSWPFFVFSLAYSSLASPRVPTMTGDRPGPVLNCSVTVPLLPPDHMSCDSLPLHAGLGATSIASNTFTDSNQTALLPVFGEAPASAAANMTPASRHNPTSSITNRPILPAAAAESDALSLTMGQPPAPVSDGILTQPVKHMPKRKQVTAVACGPCKQRKSKVSGDDDRYWPRR